MFNQTTENLRGLSHYQQMLQHEVEPSEDPACCCEPEPRWILFQQMRDNQSAGEWEVLDRSPNDEL